MRKQLIAGALGAAAVAAAVSLAPSASADSRDQAFIQRLHALGITNAKGDAVMIDRAYDVCSDMESGYSMEQEINRFDAISNLDRVHSGSFVVASAEAYCPEFSWASRS